MKTRSSDTCRNGSSEDNSIDMTEARAQRLRMFDLSNLRHAALASIAAVTVVASGQAQEIPLDSAAAPVVVDSATTVRVCAGGDVTLGTNIEPPPDPPARGQRRQRSEAEPPRPRWTIPADTLMAPLRPLVEDADIVLLNVEGAIGEGPLARQKCRPGSRSCYAFRMNPDAAGAFARLAPHARVIGNVANNHARDAGWEGLVETRRLLEQEGVAVTGIDTIATPVVLENGDTIAFLGYSTSGGPDPRDLEAVRRHVSRAAERWKRVVVTMHMGAEGIDAQRTHNETEMFLGIDRGNLVAFARAAAEAGAGLVVGHGPHVMRATEWWNGTLIAYSLGNLVTYGPFSMGEPLNRGGLLCADLDREGRVTEAVLRSTVQRGAGLVAPDPTGRAAALADSLGALDFPETAARFISESRILRPTKSP